MAEWFPFQSENPQRTEFNLEYEYSFVRGFHELLQINLGERYTLLNLMNIPDKRSSSIKGGLIAINK